MSRKRPADAPAEAEEEDDVLRSTVQLLLSCTSARQSLDANSETISKCLQATGHLVQLLAVAHGNAESRASILAAEGRHLALLSRASSAKEPRKRRLRGCALREAGEQADGQREAHMSAAVRHSAAWPQISSATQLAA